ncbi:hypothetical protein IWZ00DRAFT_222574 [Phyllosticta capitalensis]|uniref:Flavin-nucleotide-binding protein n=1 Tax=Phyllosticta capitalensis TaxID=121624 RepID=A0ABR1YRX8_9PEZI
MAEEAYAPTPSTIFNRYKERGTYDAETIHNIFNTTSVVHVSFLPTPDDPFPVILPMVGMIGTFPGDSAAEPACYLHGYVSSRLMKLSNEHTPVPNGNSNGNGSTISSPSSSTPPGLPVCVTATKVDGFKLTLTAFGHSYNYRSALVQGHATIVSDAAEKMWALQLVTDGVLPGRWEHLRGVPDAGELAATRVIKVKIAAASAKVSASVPADKRKDANNDERAGNVWVGVVPAYEAFGEPVPAPHNRVDAVPEFISDFVKNENENAEEYAVWAAGNVPGKKKTEEE